ncbi:MAG: winged helix-turn-helix transcriptional regulator [Nocardia sp.]|nr:winged helix-turn-helix transcriptional regulator [Nocardia sp.]
MHALDVLGDPVRRRVLELLGAGEHRAGAISDAVRQEFPITHPAVSHHLRVLRENGFVTVRAEGTRRLYAVDSAGMRQADEWLDRFRHMWQTRLDALDTEIARGKRERRE